MKSFYAVFAGVLLLSLTVAHAAPKSEKQIFAHYMGSYPAGAKAHAHHYRMQPKDISPDNKSMLSQVGGRTTNWSLVPQEWFYGNIELRQSAELEIKRAMRIGLDGFAIDAWASPELAKPLLDIFLTICKEKNLSFSVTVCLDPSCHKVKTENYDDSAGGHIGGMHDTVRMLLSKYGDHPNLARRDGKPLIFTYSTQGFLPNDKKLLGGGKDEPARRRAKLEVLNDLRKMVRKEFNTEIFLHHDIDNEFLGIDVKQFKDSRPPHQPGPIMAEAAGVYAEGVDNLQGQDAIGGFLGINWMPEFELVAQQVKKAGKTWAIPMWHQYNNIMGSLHVQTGTDLMRTLWDQARKTDSTLIQYVTWNDYGEDTNLSPGTATRYTIYDLTAHQIKWWKTGKQPTYDHDKVYLTYRRYPSDATIYPLNSRRSAEGVLEVATILTKPGKIQLPGRSADYDAPAGLFVKQFPLFAGPVIAQVVRNSQVELEITSPDPISDKPWREANAMVCYSSEFERQWEIDFLGTPMQTYAEYGDVDSDGLPNWFEMLYFGKLGDYTTATAANPQDDPDGDGLTNLQEYAQQSNPRKKTQHYVVGHVWDLSTVHQAGATFNPDVDSTGRKVWHYLYALGERPVPLTGEYLPCPISSDKVGYAGDMVQHTPYRDSRYKQVYGWVARHKNPADGSWMIQLRPSVNVSPILAWQAPISGKVSLVIDTYAKPDGAKRKGTLTVQRSGSLELLAEIRVPQNESVSIVLPEIQVKTGDRLYIIGSHHPDYIDVMIQNLKIELVSLSK
ncbi:MAG TPA: hypothetical protein DCM28_12605 [Phycisphaerales bacterium]|nr:hypothetical protein [Phycisphaerales bacterium]